VDVPKELVNWFLFAGALIVLGSGVVSAWRRWMMPATFERC
jgi:hypothetical protein